MTQENKDLLLRDLSARLPYGFIVHRYSDNVDIKINTIDDFSHFLEYSNDEKFKPYLRPMSSMTEEERKEYKHLIAFSGSPVGAANLVDWLNKKRFDYHTDDEGKTMIEKGIALEVPEGMY